MNYGVHLPNFGEYGDVRTLAELAREAESAGWDGFFLWDHIQFFDSAQPVPVVDLWIALAAADTDFAQLGEDPEPRARARKLDEGLTVLTRLWTAEPVEFEGEEYHVRGARFWPPPVQRPRIPIWVGGWWPRTAPIRREARWDGVFPVDRASGGMSPLSPAALREVIAYVSSHRTTTAPLDVVLSGEAPGDVAGRGAASVAPYAEAGLTRWRESLHGLRGTLAAMRARLRQGPPRDELRERRLVMSPRDTMTWVRMRQDAAFPYETAQRQLAQTLQDRASWVGEEERETPDRELRERRRKELLVAAPRLLGPLTRYVRQQLTRWEGPRAIVPEPAAVDEIVRAAFHAAVDHVGPETPATGFFPWLRRLALEQATLRGETPERRVGPVGELSRYTGEEDATVLRRLRDALAADSGPLPEELLADPRVHEWLDRLTSWLPERWREVVVLRVVEDWSVADVADAEGLTPDDVKLITDRGRAFLREWLLDLAPQVERCPRR